MGEREEMRKGGGKKGPRKEGKRRETGRKEGKQDKEEGWRRGKGGN